MLRVQPHDGNCNCTSFMAICCWLITFTRSRCFRFSMSSLCSNSWTLRAKAVYVYVYVTLLSAHADFDAMLWFQECFKFQVCHSCCSSLSFSMCSAIECSARRFFSFCTWTIKQRCLNFGHVSVRARLLHSHFLIEHHPTSSNLYLEQLLGTLLARASCSVMLCMLSTSLAHDQCTTWSPCWL